MNKSNFSECIPNNTFLQLRKITHLITSKQEKAKKIFEILEP